MWRFEGAKNCIQQNKYARRVDSSDEFLPQTYILIISTKYTVELIEWHWWYMWRWQTDIHRDSKKTHKSTESAMLQIKFQRVGHLQTSVIVYLMLIIRFGEARYQRVCFPLGSWGWAIFSLIFFISGITSYLLKKQNSAVQNAQPISSMLRVSPALFEKVAGYVVIRCLIAKNFTYLVIMKGKDARPLENIC